MLKFFQLWQNLSGPKRVATICVGGGVAFLAVYVLTLRPLQRQLIRLNQEVKDTEKRFMSALVESSQSDEVQAAFENYKPYLEHADSPELEVAAVLTEIEQAVRDSGMVLLSLKPETGIQETSNTLKISLEVESDPVQLVEVLHRLKSSKRLLRVAEMSIRRTDDKTLRSRIVIKRLSLSE